MKYLFYSEEPEEGGVVVVEPYAKDNQYADGADVTLCAEPRRGWFFSHWSERDHSPDPEFERTVCMTEDRAIAAHFYKKRGVYKKNELRTV